MDPSALHVPSHGLFLSSARGLPASSLPSPTCPPGVPPAWRWEFVSGRLGSPRAPIRAVREADGTVSVLDRRSSGDLCTVTVLALALKECGTAAGWPLSRRSCGPRPCGREVPCPPPWPSQLPLALPGPQSGHFPGGFPRLRDGGQLGAPPLAGHGTHSALHWEAATTQDPGQGGRPEVSSQTASRPATVSEK